MKIMKLTGGVLFQPGEREDTYFWIRHDPSDGTPMLIEKHKFVRYAIDGEIPDIVWLAIETGSYEIITRLPK